MKKSIQPAFSPDDDVRAEIELLKLKRELEHGTMSYHCELSPPDELNWLKQIQAFEQRHNNARRVKLFDFIGRPPYKRWYAVRKNQMAVELKKVQAVLAKNNISLDCLCTYDDAAIYRFITEELFQEVIDDIRVPDAIMHFTYEDFHPNHDYDIRMTTRNIVDAVLNRKWHRHFDGAALADKVLWAGKIRDRTEISMAIEEFQEVHSKFRVDKFNIYRVLIDAEETNAEAEATLAYRARELDGTWRDYAGKCLMSFAVEIGIWAINGFQMPGINSE